MTGDFQRKWKKNHFLFKECKYNFKQKKYQSKILTFVGTTKYWGPVHTWALRTSFSSLSLSVTASLWARTCWKRKHTSSDQLIYVHVQWNQKNNFKWGIILQYKNYVQDIAKRKIAKRKITGHIRKKFTGQVMFMVLFFFFLEILILFYNVHVGLMSSPWVWHSHLSIAQPVLQPPQSEPSCPQSVSGTPHWRQSNSVKSSGENLRAKKKIVLIFQYKMYFFIVLCIGSQIKIKV